MSNGLDYSLNEQIYQNSDKTIRIYKVKYIYNLDS